MQPKRIEWLDISKGIAVVLVVYGHAARGLEVAELISFDGAWGYIDYLVYTVHMPVFFVVSGFLYERGREKPRDSRSFWADKIASIAWPYFLWTTIHVSIQTMMSGSGAVNNHTNLGRLLSIGWNPVSPFWFLYALFVAFAASFVLQKISIRFVTFAAASLMLAAYGLDAPQVICDITYGLVYFSLGRLVNTEKLSDRSRSLAVLAATIVAFVSAASVAYRLGVHVRLETVGTLIGLTAFLLFSQALAETAVTRPLVIIGRCTMGIYVMHIFVIAAFRALGITVLNIGPTGIVLGCTVFAVLLPLFAQVIANMLGIAKFVGLKTKLDDVLWRRPATEPTAA